jgi:Tfp pilus assembly protein PilN
MIRTNLSTRPFYNERAVYVWLLLVGAVVLGATAFNVSRVIRYSRSDTQLATQASQDETRAANLRKEAARLRASLDPRQLEFASAEARQANDLIDQRTFSWTELLNRFETTLPDEVRIGAVRPRVERGRGIILSLNVVARSVDDVSLFMERLESTGAFANLRPTEEHFNDQGQLESMLEMNYVPAAAKPAADTPAAAAEDGKQP